MSKSNRLSSLFAVMGAIFPAKALTSANRNFDELVPYLAGHIGVDEQMPKVGITVTQNMTEGEKYVLSAGDSHFWFYIDLLQDVSSGFFKIYFGGECPAEVFGVNKGQVNEAIISTSLYIPDEIPAGQPIDRDEVKQTLNKVKLFSGLQKQLVAAVNKSGEEKFADLIDNSFMEGLRKSATDKALAAKKKVESEDSSAAAERALDEIVSIASSMVFMLINTVQDKTDFLRMTVIASLNGNGKLAEEIVEKYKGVDFSSGETRQSFAKDLKAAVLKVAQDVRQEADKTSISNKIDVLIAEVENRLKEEGITGASISLYTSEEMVAEMPEALRSQLGKLPGVSYEGALKIDITAVSEENQKRAREIISNVLNDFC